VSVRYCKVCAGDVEEVDGYCLLGHPLKLSPPSVAEMRDEVARALGEARTEQRPDADGEAVPDALHSGDGNGLHHLWNARDMTWSPPPPVEDPRQTVWGPLVGDAADEGDPITAFAPASRMDWGPERSGFRARRPLKRKSGPAPA
jgi:hypothetical protein